MTGKKIRSASKRSKANKNLTVGWPWRLQKQRPLILVVLAVLIALSVWAINSRTLSYDIRNWAIGGDFCEKLNRNRCVQNSQYCQWQSNTKSSTNKSVKCEAGDCRKGKQGCNWETNNKGKQVCKGKYQEKKNVGFNDGKCMLRADIQEKVNKGGCWVKEAQRVIADKERWENKICKKGQLLKIRQECSRAVAGEGGAGCIQLSNYKEQWIQCDQYFQVMKTRTCTRKQLCDRAKGCINKSGGPEPIE